MTSLGSGDPDRAQEAVFRFLADPKTHGLSEPVERVDTAARSSFSPAPTFTKLSGRSSSPSWTCPRSTSAVRLARRKSKSTAPQRRKSIWRRSPSRDMARPLRSEATGKSSNGPCTCGDSTRTRRSITSPIGKASRTRSSTSWRSRSAACTLAPRSGTAARAAHALETYIEQNDARFRRAARSLRHGRGAQAHRRFAARIREPAPRPYSSAARPASFAAVTAICTCATSCSSNGEPTLFDAVEFSDDIASGDVLYDLAFLLMDLEERGLRAAANRLFNRYLASEPPDALTGLVALPLFLSLRAAIRAKVEAAGAERLEREKRDAARMRCPPILRLRDPIS